MIISNDIFHSWAHTSEYSIITLHFCGMFCEGRDDSVPRRIKKDITQWVRFQYTAEVEERQVEIYFESRDLYVLHQILTFLRDSSLEDLDDFY
jgi:hypothetical protein